MLNVIGLFWRLCVFREHPSSVPSADWFVYAVLAANVGVSLTLSVYLSPDVPLVALATAVFVQQAVLASLLFAALYLRNLSRRFTRTMTAVFGCDLILTALQGALLVLVPDHTQLWFQFILLAFFLWIVAIIGQILQRALDVQLPVAIGLALAFIVLATAFGSAAVQ
ncbi:MAG: hypothetical protein H6993_10335 [Pseudomonadales bacterium]|nr:hypothetical protein [Pseudomonadales bacterium]